MRHLFCTAASAAMFLACGPAFAAPPPAAAFGAMPAIQVADISPDGKSVAILGVDGGQGYVAIDGLDDGKAVTLPLGTVDAFALHWAGNTQVIMKAQVVIHPPGADPAVKYEWTRDIIIGRDGKVIGQVLGNNPVSALTTVLPIISYGNPTNPQLIVRAIEETSDAGAENASGGSRLQSKRGDFVAALYRVDPATGKGILFERGDGSVENWDVDLQGQPRVRWGRDPVTHVFTVEAHGKGKTGWSQVYKAERYGDEMQYLGYSDPEDAIYYLPASSHGVVKMTLADGKESVVTDKLTGASVGMIWDPWRESAVAAFTTDDVTHYEWVDPEIGGVYASMTKAFKDRVVSIENWSSDRTRYIVKVDGGAAPPVWYLFDKAQHSVSPLGEEYPALKDVPLGQREWITYKARDGLEIPAYVTYPPGVTPETASKLPLIVMPHGGPAARDEPGFDYWSQFVASRGYVVIQPQFRGSDGFGLAFLHAGYREWGGKMQTDLLDGVSTLAAKGRIDPSRVCIVGWSYGGYAALEGITSHPEAYKCAVSVNGISDLPLLFKEEIQRGGRGVVEDEHNQLGDPADNREQLSNYSPVQHVGAVNGPVLLIAGQDDQTVIYEQSTHMQKALEDAGKSVELVSFKGDDHYLHTTADRTAMLEALDKFLAVNLPVK
jgi:dipeptidyl aminopeptidase/acylaminoacyl peptidase